MATIEIGEWVRRPSTKTHLVDSTVADDVLTRCGRRMAVRAGQGSALGVDVQPDESDYCQTCSYSLKETAQGGTD